MKFRGMRGALAALGIGCLLAHAQAADLGTNLIVNGDAEAGLAGWSPIDTTTPLFDAVRYDDAYWGLGAMPSPPDRGEQLFVGGAGHVSAVGVQRLDLGSFAAASGTAGALTYSLSGWLGGWSSQADDAVLTALFLDADGDVIDVAELGPVTPADRGDVTSLQFRELSGVLPTDARAVQFLLSMERAGGGDNDGYADNLAFVISSVPEPTTSALFGAGLGLAGLAALRRRGGR